MEELENMVVMKVCSKCKNPKELNTDNFPRNKSSKDGFSHWCKACHKQHRIDKKAKPDIGEPAEPDVMEMDAVDEAAAVGGAQGVDPTDV